MTYTKFHTVFHDLGLHEVGTGILVPQQVYTTPQGIADPQPPINFGVNERQGVSLTAALNDVLDDLHEKDVALNMTGTGKVSLRIKVWQICTILKTRC